jgi:hypothetical protein
VCARKAHNEHLRCSLHAFCACRELVWACVQWRVYVDGAVVAGTQNSHNEHLGCSLCVSRAFGMHRATVGFYLNPLHPPFPHGNSGCGGSRQMAAVGLRWWRWERWVKAGGGRGSSRHKTARAHTPGPQSEHQGCSLHGSHVFRMHDDTSSCGIRAQTPNKYCGSVDNLRAWSHKILWM